MSGALDGLRVVEISGGGIAGPYATKLLVDLGADVTMVEPPTGDCLRRWGPFPDGVEDLDRSGLFEYLNAGKRGVTLDLAAQAAHDEFRELIRSADVLLETLLPGTLTRWGFGPESLVLVNPELVVVRISNFGQDGPWRDREATPLTMQAASGWISKRDPARPPVQAGARISEFVAGAYATLGALTALRARPNDSSAITEVDVSVLESLISTLPYPMLAFEKMRRIGMKPSGRAGPVLGVVKAADGWVGINCLTGQHWLDVCAMVGLPEYGELQMAVIQGGPERDEFFKGAQEWLEAQTVTEIVELSQAMRIPAAPVSDGASVLTCPQYQERGFFVEAGDGDWAFKRPGGAVSVVQDPRPEAGSGATTGHTIASGS